MALIDFVHKPSFLIGISTESVETQHRISRESAKINRHAADTQHRLRKSAEVSRQSPGIKSTETEQNQNGLGRESAQDHESKKCHSYQIRCKKNTILGLRMMKREKTDDMEKASVEVTKQPCWVMTH